jgi:hypothetical protein
MKRFPNEENPITSKRGIAFNKEGTKNKFQRQLWEILMLNGA